MSQRRNNRSIGETAVCPANAVKECVRFILCQEGSKIPIKRPEIVKHLQTTCQTPNNLVKNVITEANNVLKNVYGYKLVEVKVGREQKQVQYIIVLQEPCKSLPTPHMPHRKLLIAALMHIFMTGGPVVDTDMWSFLEKANLLGQNDDAGKKLLTNTFTKQLYLQYNKEGEKELARFVFEWGKRAEEEVPKMFLLEKMAEAFETEPKYWWEQYKIANPRQNT